MVRRRTKWLVGVVVSLMVAFTVLIAPAEASRAVKATYRALPSGVRDVVPNSWEQGLGRGIDDTARVLSFGDPDRLVDLTLRLEYASIPPNSWGPDHSLTLEWSDLGSGISYDVNVGHSPTDGGVDIAAQRHLDPNATIPLPGDGDWYVRVRPVTNSEQGRMTVFGPFRIDSTPPSAPSLDAILPPPGYIFPVTWRSVTDASGIQGYQVERQSGAQFTPIGITRELRWQEDQLGNGIYRYQIRAINGAGLLSPASNVQQVTVKAPMNNPGPGAFRYGIHANYTSFLKLWDISDPSLYATIDQAPLGIKNQYLAGGWGFEIDNQTLIRKTREIVGSEKNTMKIAEKLFTWLYDYADYDTCKISPRPADCPASTSEDDSDLQPASLTFDRRKGICGDLATLYITMLRIAGVPARPVHGYLDNSGATGGVRIGDFHVWVEAWVGTSLKTGDPSDTRSDWMTIDVSGISGDFEPEYLMVYFGIFNPEYLALGLDADYTQASWNSWAQFGWTKRSGDTGSPRFTANGAPVQLSSRSMNMFFDVVTKKRVLVEEGQDPPRGYSQFFPDIMVESKKRIDYGVNLSGDIPVNATIRLRFPQADAYANVLPWQSVIFTIYQKSSTVNTCPITKLGEAAKPYCLDKQGFVVWDDDFRSN